MESRVDSHHFDYRRPSWHVGEQQGIGQGEQEPHIGQGKGSEKCHQRRHPHHHQGTDARHTGQPDEEVESPIPVLKNEGNYVQFDPRA